LTPFVAEVWGMVDASREPSTFLGLAYLSSTRSGAWGKYVLDRGAVPGTPSARRVRDAARRRGIEATRMVVHEPDGRCRL
jgi:hypothetical protein